MFLPGESQGQGGLVGCHLWGRTESDMTEVIQHSSSSEKVGMVQWMEHRFWSWTDLGLTPDSGLVLTPKKLKGMERWKIY